MGEPALAGSFIGPGAAELSGSDASAPKRNRALHSSEQGAVQGADAMSRYLTKLFASWRMEWTPKELFPLDAVDGAAALWRASFRRPDGEQTVEADGMDIVLVEGERIKRNEVYFDRAVLAPLFAQVGQAA